jgi:hypothetical protein
MNPTKAECELREKNMNPTKTECELRWYPVFVVKT